MNRLTTSLDTDLTITNQTSKPVMMAQVQEDSNTAQVAYAQPLLALPNNTQPAVIAAAATAYLSLDAPTQDACNLIAMRPDNLFPVSNQMAVVPLDCTQQPSSKCGNGITAYYSDITLTQADSDAMQQAFFFYQTVLAYPDSDVVKNFFALLTTYEADPLNLETAINQYFQQTQDYSQCTLASYIAVNTYCRNYAYAWANLQTSFTYQVFQSATDPKAAKGLVPSGKIVLSKQPHAPTPTDVNDHNAGYNITYVPTQGSQRSLTLIDGALVSTDNPSAPSVGFLLTYNLKSTFTQVETDTTAWPVLMGQIDGVQMVAVGDVATATPASPTSATGNLKGDWKDDFVKYFTPETVIDWVKVIGTSMGMAAGVGALCYGVYKLVQFIRGGQAQGPDQPPRTPEEIRAELIRIRKEVLPKIMTVEGEELYRYIRYNKADFQRTNEEWYKAEYGKLVTARQMSSYYLDRQLFAEDYKTYSELIDELAKYGVTNELQAATTKLREAAQIAASKPALWDFDFRDHRAKISAALKTVKELIEEAKVATKRMGVVLGDEVEKLSERSEASRAVFDQSSKVANLEEEGGIPIKENPEILK